MLTINDYPYYQPVYKDADGNPTGTMPQELFSFQAFRSEENCREWLWQNGYDDEQFEICEYCNDDIDGVTIIDEYGDIIDKIEEVTDYEREQSIVDELTFVPHEGDRKEGEDEDAYNDRLYGIALDKVNHAIGSVETKNEYDFSSYGGNPDTEWYDEVRDDVVRMTVLRLRGEIKKFLDWRCRGNYQGRIPEA
jgi:hypothetical protein